MADVAGLQQAIGRMKSVRHRRVGAIYGWRPPADGWTGIVVDTFPEIQSIRKIPPGWCDLVLALADHIDGSGIVVMQVAENPQNGQLLVQHRWRLRDYRDLAVEATIDAYETASKFVCRECGSGGAVIKRGTGKLSKARALCERHMNGDGDE